MTKWRWFPVKQTGHRPCPRSGFSSAAIPNSNRAIFFGGVQDDEDTNMAVPDSDDEDDVSGVFFNDLYGVAIDGEKATWQKIELTGPRHPEESKKRKQKEDPKESKEDPMTGGAAEELKTLELAEAEEEKTKVVESGAFTISSTISSSKSEPEKVVDKVVTSVIKPQVGGPSPRFGSQMVIRQGTLFLYGGMVEDDDDRQLTFNDFYSLGKLWINYF